MEVESASEQQPRHAVASSGAVVELEDSSSDISSNEQVGVKRQSQ